MWIWTILQNSPFLKHKEYQHSNALRPQGGDRCYGDDGHVACVCNERSDVMMERQMNNHIASAASVTEERSDEGYTPLFVNTLVIDGGPFHEVT